MHVTWTGDAWVRNTISHGSHLAHCFNVYSSLDKYIIFGIVIGASLSEPYTSVTALRTRVSIRLSGRLWTDHIP